MPNNELNQFYIALGKAMCEWQYLEEELFWMYRFFLGRADSEIASAAFYSHHSFRGKTRLLKTSGKIYFEANIGDRTQYTQGRMRECIRNLKDVLASCEKLSEKRNDLAHHMIGYDDSSSSVVLAPPYPARILKDVPPKSTKDILSICEEFTDLADFVSYFNRSLRDDHMPIW